MRERGVRTNLKHSQLLMVVLLGSLGLGGCVANITGDDQQPGGPGGPGSPGGPGAPGSPGGPGVTPAECAQAGPQVGPERIYRLTPEEYTSSLRVLLGDDTLEPELDADREPIATLDGVRKWYNAADRAVPASVSWLSTYGTCDPAADAACAVTLYEAFAERAFRRPLDEEERSWLSTSWAALPQAASVALRLEVMSELILQAPQYLYLYTEGTPAGAINTLDGHERAQRLSYFLWDSLPDQALLDAAASGELDTPAGMRKEASRMLGDERAKPVLRAFLSDWLELDGATILPGLDVTPKDSELFSGFDQVLRDSMRREIESFMDYVMFERDGSLEALFTGTRAYVNGPLAELYGVAGPSSADEWAWVDLDPTQRAGMLTRAGFLAVHATQTVTSPIRRGVYMLKEVLCYDLPSPPANVDNTPIETSDGATGDVITVRQATLARTGNPTCAGCHTMINELGFAFEHYDAVGRWQETELGSGGTIDATATLSNAAGEGLEGPVDGALELSARLAHSPEVARCATEKWFEVALRRSPVEVDACSVAAIRGKVGQAPSIRELLLALAESDAFLHVNHGE